MIDQLIAEFDNTRSGAIYRVSPGYYYPAVGWDQCKTGENVTYGITHRMFVSFDTSSLPDHAQIEEVVFRCRRAADPIGDPEEYHLHFSIGTFIGAALEETDWALGDLMVTLDEKPADKQDVDLSADGADPRPHVNRTGYTDVKVWDGSLQIGGDPEWGTNFNPATLSRCKLFVTYSVPSATLTARGSFSASAVVIRGAAATLTARASAEFAATAIVSGSVVATGVGRADFAGGVILSSANCTMEGRGSLEAAGGVLHASAGATLTGRASAEFAAAAIVRGSCTATARGIMTAAAGVLRSTAAATMTGRAFFSCSGNLGVLPLAVHAATLSVNGIDSGDRTVRAVHDSEIDLANIDAAVREPRRVD